MRSPVLPLACVLLSVGAATSAPTSGQVPDPPEPQWPALEDAPPGLMVLRMVRAVILLPQWVNRSEADRRMNQDWRVFLRRLRRHEESHRSIALATATKFLQQAERTEAKTCAHASIGRLWTRILEEGRRAQNEFDARAVEIRWPPRWRRKAL